MREQRLTPLAFTHSLMNWPHRRVVVSGSKLRTTHFCGEFSGGHDDGAVVRGVVRCSRVLHFQRKPLRPLLCSTYQSRPSHPSAEEDKRPKRDEQQHHSLVRISGNVISAAAEEEPAWRRCPNARRTEHGQVINNATPREGGEETEPNMAFYYCLSRDSVVFRLFLSSPSSPSPSWGKQHL